MSNHENLHHAAGPAASQLVNEIASLPDIAQLAKALRDDVIGQPLSRR